MNAWDYTRDHAKEVFPILVGKFWAGVPGLSEYLVSDEGDVLSFKKAPRFLKPIQMGQYVGVQLGADDGTRVKKYIHRLVLEAFEWFAPDGHEARHLNGDRTQNRYSNLAWGTRLENHADKRIHGTTAAGERNPQAKLTQSKVTELRALYSAGGWSFKRLGEKFGVSTMTAHRAIRRTSWTA